MTIKSPSASVKPDFSADTDPLGAMSDLLADDMRAVNEVVVANMQSDVALIPRIAGYLVAAGGKRIRPLLTVACTRLFGGDMARAYGLAAAVEFVHTATLLHDDVIDESEERRGQDTANRLHGNAASVLVGDFLFSRSFQLMVADEAIEILRILSKASAVIAEGEVMQLSTLGNIKTTRDQYYKVIGAKTAALFAAACEIGPVIAGQKGQVQEDMRRYGRDIGMAFQIADDILDYNPEASPKLGKEMGDDFREGKMSLPVIMAIERADADELAFWQRTLANPGSQQAGDLEQAQAIMEKHNILGQCLDIAASFARQAQDALQSAPDDDLRKHLHDLADFALSRAY